MVWQLSDDFRNELRKSGFRHSVTPLIATQCHHSRGRRGTLLLEKRYWIPVSAEGHSWIDRNPKQARELGLLCQPGQYNAPPNAQANRPGGKQPENI
jgi:hypothetical protein